MSQSSTLFIGMDVHKDSIAVAYVAQDHGAESAAGCVHEEVRLSFGPRRGEALTRELGRSRAHPTRMRLEALNFRLQQTR